MIQDALQLLLGEEARERRVHAAGKMVDVERGLTIHLDRRQSGDPRCGTDARARAHGSRGDGPRGWKDGRLVFECDDVIAATGFRTPLGDLTKLGVATVADGRIPALTPFWESVSVPGVYFAGNATQGSAGLRKQGLSPSNSAVNGFRYYARVLVRQR